MNPTTGRTKIVEQAMDLLAIGERIRRGNAVTLAIINSGELLDVQDDPLKQQICDALRSAFGLGEGRDRSALILIAHQAAVKDKDLDFNDTTLKRLKAQHARYERELEAKLDEIRTLIGHLKQRRAARTCARAAA